MKTIKVSEIIRRLRKDGWYLDRQRGDHRQFKHPIKKGLVTIRGQMSEDITGDLLKSIEKQSGVVF